MGEIADDMIDGTTCSLCGMFFRNDGKTSPLEEGESVKLFTHGHPVVCWACWEGLTKKERKKHCRALRTTL